MANLVGSEQVHHIHKVQELQASADVQAASIISKGSLFFDDMRLVHIGGLRMLIKKDKVPETFLRRGITTDDRFRTCADWLQWAQEKDYEYTIDGVFPLHYVEDDFVEIPIGNHSWDSLIVKLQQDVAALQASDAQDQAETVAEIATALLQGGSIDNRIDTLIAAHHDGVDDDASNFVLKSITDNTGDQTIQSNLTVDKTVRSMALYSKDATAGVPQGYVGGQDQVWLGGHFKNFEVENIGPKTGVTSTVGSTGSPFTQAYATAVESQQIAPKLTAGSYVGTGAKPFNDIQAVAIGATSVDAAGITSDGIQVKSSSTAKIGTSQSPFNEVYANEITTKSLKKADATSSIGATGEAIPYAYLEEIFQCSYLGPKTHYEGGIGTTLAVFGNSFIDEQHTRRLLPLPSAAGTAPTLGTGSDPWPEAHVADLHVTGTAFAKTGRFQKSSVWLGDDIHLGNQDGRTHLHERKKIIPKFLADAGVVEADFVAVGTTSAAVSMSATVCKF